MLALRRQYCSDHGSSDSSGAVFAAEVAKVWAAMAVVAAVVVVILFKSSYCFYFSSTSVENIVETTIRAGLGVYEYILSNNLSLFHRR